MAQARNGVNGRAKFTNYMGLFFYECGRPNSAFGPPDSALMFAGHSLNHLNSGNAFPRQTSIPLATTLPPLWHRLKLLTLC